MRMLSAHACADVQAFCYTVAPRLVRSAAVCPEAPVVWRLLRGPTN